ncbi:MAG: peptidase inhibitor family I36 protein, partial [Acidobacteria bacterium]|nr:peptidase inhibitor family I36 protein [Acidobacteriota bacterium]
REYLKERRKAYKEEAQATREERREFEQYLRDRSQAEREDTSGRDRDWEEYLKRQNKVYKAQSQATREELGDYARYLRERNQQEHDRQWRAFLNARQQGYKPFATATEREREEFEQYRRETLPGPAGSDRSGDQGRWGGFGTPRNGACFFTNADYGGNRFCMEAGERKDYVGDGYNDKISSVRVYGRARVTLYQDSGFRGSERLVTSDAPGLESFNDRTSSIEVR